MAGSCVLLVPTLNVHKSMGFSVELATIVALFVESVGWGINCVSFFICMNALLLLDGHLKPLSTVNYISISTALLMFSIATFDIAIVVSRNIKWFVDADPGTAPSISKIANWWTVAEVSTFIAQAFVGDAILIYRCFVIWNRKWLVTVFPVVTWLAGTACGVAGLVIKSPTLYATTRAPVRPFLTTLIVLTAVTNFISSSLILFCIWNIHRHSARYYRSYPGRDPLARAIRIIIESGGLYTVSTLILLITYSNGHSSQIIAGRAIIQVIGITFNLIIGRNARRKDSFIADGNRREAVGTSPLRQMSLKTHVFVSRDSPNSVSGSGGSTGSDAETRINCV